MLDIANFFPLLNLRATNDGFREGTLLLEYFQASITLTTNEGSVEVPTQLDEVLGLIDLSYAADPANSTKIMTDGVIATGAVTVAAKSDVASGAITVRGFLVGKKEPKPITLTEL